MKPLIAVTPDEGLSDALPGRPPLARYEIKAAYAQAIIDAGGLPLVVPYAPESVEQIVALCDGFVVTGGAFDVSPEEYGDTARAGMGPVKLARTTFERRLIEKVLQAGKPLLGICGGMQLLNVVQGGTLIQHIPNEVPNALPHEQAHDPRQPAHDVLVAPDSELHRIVQVESLAVNTTHHQAVAKVGRGLSVSGRANDGVIEAIEGAGEVFVLGVQWHPELLADDAARRIYRALVEAARR